MLKVKEKKDRKAERKSMRNCSVCQLIQSFTYMAILKLNQMMCSNSLQMQQASGGTV